MGIVTAHFFNTLNGLCENVYKLGCIFYTDYQTVSSILGCIQNPSCMWEGEMGKTVGGVRVKHTSTETSKDTDRQTHTYIKRKVKPFTCLPCRRSQVSFLTSPTNESQVAKVEKNCSLGPWITICQSRPATCCLQAVHGLLAFLHSFLH